MNLEDFLEINIEDKRFVFKFKQSGSIIRTYIMTKEQSISFFNQINELFEETKISKSNTKDCPLTRIRAFPL